jgi:hypothetical protein
MVHDKKEVHPRTWYVISSGTEFQEAISLAVGDQNSVARIRGMDELLFLHPTAREIYEYILIRSSCLRRILYFNFMWSLTSFPFSLSRDFQIFISPTRPVGCKASGIYELLAAPAAHDGIY